MRCSGWATLLTILTAARTGEIIGARVEEFADLKYAGRALWRVPESRMKAGREHLVPLSTQAVSVVKAAMSRQAAALIRTPALTVALITSVQTRCYLTAMRSASETRRPCTGSLVRPLPKRSRPADGRRT